MSFDGYLCLGGIEVINRSRLAQMLAAGLGQEGLECRDCAPCPDLDKGLGFEGLYNPSTNPWYDPDEPDSADFAGLLVTSIVGLEPGPFVRPVTEKVGFGAVLGQGRQNAPQVVVTGILMARTCCAVEFGYRWLRKALKGSCGPSTVCAGDDLVFLSCEPVFGDEDCGPVDFEAELLPYIRTFKGAALIDGPRVTQTIPRGCPTCYECGFTEVQFTLSAADPCIYREPITLLENVQFTCSNDEGDCITWVDDDTDCDSDCVSETPCSTDPSCVDVSPPTMPSIINSCVSDCITSTQCVVSCDIPDGTFPLTAEGTLIVSIFAGDAPLEGIEVKVWENPLGLPLDQLDDCAVCASLAISYVAAGATLVIDGGARTAQIECVGGSTVRANPFIANANGSGSFSYPTFVCGSDYTVAVITRPGVSPTAAVTVQAVPREC